MGELEQAEAKLAELTEMASNNFDAATRERDRADAQMTRAEAAEAKLAAIAEWAHRHGVELCPRASCADTYGDGVRQCKSDVLSMVTALRDGGEHE